MSWFDDVAKYIEKNLEEYAEKFLKPTEIKKAGKSLFINSCPFCGGNNSFTLTRGVNSGHCFSCSESGTPIQLAEKLHGEIEAREMLSEWTGKQYDFGRHTPENSAAREKFLRYHQILNKAVVFYQNRLLSNIRVTDTAGISKSPLEHQAKVRKHKLETITAYKVGYSGDFHSLKQSLLEDGFEEHEIAEASKLIRVPDGYFIYPYFDEKGHLIRFNCKMFLRICRGKVKKTGGYHYDCDYTSFRKDDVMKKAHESTKEHEMTPDSLSRGSKVDAFFANPLTRRKKRKKFLILVEGENDVLSVEEALLDLPRNFSNNFEVRGIGGGWYEGMFKHASLREFEIVYTAFDNDPAGDTYREKINEEAPDVALREIQFPEKYNDVDELLKNEPDAAERLQALIEEAVIITTNGYIITREPKKHLWTCKNRHYEIKYEIDYYLPNKNGFKGTLIYFKNGLQTDKKVGDIDAVKLPSEALTRLKLSLSNEIQEFYHNVRMVKDEPQRTFEELLSIFFFTKHRDEVTKQIAWYVFHAPQNEKEMMIKEVQFQIKKQSELANILKEINGFENQEIDPDATFPKLQIAQTFFPTSGDGYIYFAKNIKDGDVVRRVPCLITNKKEEIRLDLLKKKDSQSLILINNKYELPMEVENNFVDVEDLSLQAPFVKKWLKGEINEEKIHPSYVVREIADFIRKTYATSEDVVKVLSLWIYATYFYSLFKDGFPYLLFNGGKGSGKSTIDSIIYLLSFNPVFSVNISGAALFRRIHYFGGTFILDEMENLMDEKKNSESDIATVVKAGYASNGKVYRVDPDTGLPQSFDVFGPKVISNITGVSDVVGDRCIEIKTFAAPEEKLRGLERIDVYKGEKRGIVYDITSRTALSALTHFREVSQIFQTNTRVDTGNARLTQIFRPLVTIAKLVGGDYESHLMSFYKTEIEDQKKETSRSTLDGKIKFILLSISEEILGYSNNPWVLKSDHLYNKQIPYSTDGTFEIDTMHFKVLAEELADDPNENYTPKQIHAAVKNVMGRNFNMKQRIKPTRLAITDENLIRQMNGKKYPHGNRYTFNVREFITKRLESIKYNSDQPEESLF